MGLLDRLKEGAGQAKELAQQAAERAKEEAKELQLKRQLAGEYEALGQEAFELVQGGELAHARLGPGVERIRNLKAELAALESGGEGGEQPEQTGTAPPPPA